MMDFSLNAAAAFGELLNQNPRASAYYDRCTPEQRNAILLQMGQLTSWEQLRAFVDNLPSATL